MLLRPSVKNYPWGKVGPNSLVSQLMSNWSSTNNEPVQLSPEETYAELWMGAHPSGPSIVYLDGQNKNADESQEQALSDYILRNPSVLGENITKKFEPNLPFLFKVLSVEKALSIQAHPDKELASKLYLKDPKNYPDSNHKPEMAIAITPFEVLCGFRSFDEINAFIRDIPELRKVTGSHTLTTKDDLRKVYKQMMTCDNELVKEQISQLIERKNDSVPEYELISRLNSQFPGDIGIFNVYFLQHFTLQPGEALFLPANEPHAYMSGDCMECMANSDNVVRAGLTPKFKDVDVLVEMLTFEAGKNWIFGGVDTGNGKTVFTPPVPDFAVEKIMTTEDFTINSSKSCSIVLVLEGNGTLGPLKLSRGSVLFLPSDYVGSVACNNTQVLLFRAFCP